MLGFILSLFGILFLLAIAFLIGMIAMVYLLTEVIAKVPVDEYIEMFEELKELHLTDEKDIVDFFQKKFNELKYQYGGDNE